jgi:hypothetical protein
MQVLRENLDMDGLTAFYSYACRVRRDCDIPAVPSVEPFTCLQLPLLENGILPSLTSLVPSGREMWRHEDKFLQVSFLPVILQCRSFSCITCLSVCCDDPHNEHQIGNFVLTLANNVNA